MCLKTVSPEKPKSSGFGYKVLIVDKNGLMSAFMETRLPWRQWAEADNGGGFHIYATLKKAQECLRWYDITMSRSLPPQDRKNYRVFKVEYRGATKQGTGDGGFTENARVIVADEIYVF